MGTQIERVKRIEADFSEFELTTIRRIYRKAEAVSQVKLVRRFFCVKFVDDLSLNHGYNKKGEAA